MLNFDLAEQKKIDDATTKMYLWLDTWRQQSGAYNGYVVHRYDLKRLKFIHETPWGHCAIIEGLISLYEKNRTDELRDKIEAAVELQISRLDEDCSFINAGFEDDRFSSLVHNSMADRALLTYYNSEIPNADLKQKALETVQLNVNKYLIGNLWNETIGAFKFSKVDYYSPNLDRYVANMNCVAVEVMLELFRLTNEYQYYDYSKRCSKWVKTQTVNSDNKFCDGGISYGSNNPECIVGIYTGLCLPGLCQMYQAFQDDDLKIMAIRAVENLLTYTCEGYFCHSMDGDEEKRHPFFIAGAGIILYGIQYVNESLNTEYDTSLYLKNILDKQYKMGGVQNFIGYNCKGNNRNQKNSSYPVWEDAIACVPWNAQLFRYLAKVSTGLTEVNVKFPTLCIKPGFIYYETKKSCFISSIIPLKSMVLLIMNKQKDKSVFSFALKGMVSKIRKMLTRR